MRKVGQGVFLVNVILGRMARAAAATTLTCSVVDLGLLPRGQTAARAAGVLLSKSESESSKSEDTDFTNVFRGRVRAARSTQSSRTLAIQIQLNGQSTGRGRILWSLVPFLAAAARLRLPSRITEESHHPRPCE